MLQWLTNILTPVFEGMGVSAVDVQTYVNMLSGYIYAIVIILLAVIIMMFVAQKAKKGTRHVVRWISVVAGVTAIAVIANMICFGPMHDNLSALMNGLGTVFEGNPNDKKTKKQDYVVIRFGHNGFNNVIAIHVGNDSRAIFAWRGKTDNDADAWTEDWTGNSRSRNSSIKRFVCSGYSEKGALALDDQWDRIWSFLNTPDKEAS